MDTELFTAKEIAERLNLKPRTITMWGRQQKIPRVKVSYKIIRYNFDAVKKALMKIAAENGSENGQQHC